MYLQAYPPIYGSQINPSAKLYKRFAPTETMKVGSNIVKIQQNYFATYFNFRFADADKKDLGDNQNIKGGELKGGDYAIKLYGRWNPVEGAADEFEPQDIIEFGGSWWQIKDIVNRKRNKSMINFATIVLMLEKIDKQSVLGVN